MKKTKGTPRSAKPAVRKACSRCIGDEYLKKVVNRCGKRSKCTYCRKTSVALEIGILAIHTKRLFDDHFVLKRQDAEHPEFDFMNEMEGNVNYIIREHADVDIKIADDIQNELMKLSYSEADNELGVDNSFDRYALYNRKQIDSGYWDSLWNDLKNSIMKENRLFNGKARKIFRSIFHNIIVSRDQKGDKVTALVEIGPNTRTPKLYRAREFQSEKNLYYALSHPDRALGPPPSPRAIAGRMNASGVSMFYGATQIDVAIAEIRPAVGSRVIVAHFDVTRNLKLLDIEKLKSVFVGGSMFKPSHKRNLEKFKFISSLCEQISAPVMPADQSSDYLVTQAISDYLSELEFPTPIDGIIYQSSQKGNDTTNVALFHKSSRVKFRKKPAKIEVLKYFEYISDEDIETIYYVYETMSSNKEKCCSSDKCIKDNECENDDDRVPSLALEPSSIYVHFIKSVTFDTREQATERVPQKED